MQFKEFAKCIRDRFYSMSEEGPLFVVDIEKEVLLKTYQDAFPRGTNEIFRERREHDCNSCNKFISRIGPVVQIVNKELITVWGVSSDLLEGKYRVVAKAMDELIKSRKISRIFLTDPLDKKVGVESNIEDLTISRYGHDTSKDPKGISSIRWHHFSCIVPDRFISGDRNTKIGEATATRTVFERGLKEISLTALEIVLDLIDSNSIYRGEEFKEIIETFKKHKMAYSARNAKEKEYYTWLNYANFSAKIRNTAIGTLLLDLSMCAELNDAVLSYERKVAPENYKRSSAPITKGLIDKAIAKIDELGLRESLERRYAVLGDISVNNVIFVDRATAMAMRDNIAALLKDEVRERPQNDSKEVPIKQFIEEIVPQCTNIEMFVGNTHENNLVSLIAPMHNSAPALFKWPNNFSWAYNGDVTDSLMKQRVKSMGGNVNAYLRYSIQWNENGDNNNDFDAHIIEPTGNHIYFPNRGIVHLSSGHLDVDIIHPDREVAVENITYTDPLRMPEGVYDLFVNCYSHRGGRTGFRAELEFEGAIHKFSYDKNIQQRNDVSVARISYSREKGIEIIESLPYNRTSQELWGIKTEKFHKVGAIMYSPNHWDNMGIGNRHYFFMLEGCRNPGKARGFYNEFLKSELTRHRKVFEVLGGKMKCDESPNQVSGLGFSSTKRDSVIVRVTGRTFKVIF